MPARRLSVPPGRAGRLWLQRRLGVAERGAGLLDRKLRILRGELAGLRAARDLAATDWDRCSAEAEVWLLRAALLGGQRALRLSAGGLAEVTVGYAAVMGIRYPAAVSCAFPEPQTWDAPVTARARQAHRAALAAAADYAAAAEAVRLVEREALATRHRLRAIRDRWMPRLERELAAVTLALEEQEIADAARLRLGAGRTRAVNQGGALGPPHRCE